MLFGPDDRPLRRQIGFVARVELIDEKPAPLVDCCAYKTVPVEEDYYAEGAD